MIIKPLSAVAFEDLRIEASGPLSFMGVRADGQFEFPEFPAYVRLGIALIADVLDLGKDTVFVKLRFNGELKWAGEADIEVDALSTGVIVPIIQTFAMFEKQGELELLLSFGEDREDGGEVVKTWSVVEELKD